MVNLPHHLAIIPDGNRRWAKEKGLPISRGHQEGLENLKKLASFIFSLKIPILTVWGFSTENWERTKKEIYYLMKIFRQAIDIYLEEAIQKKIRLIHLGRKDRIDQKLREKIIEAEVVTQKFTERFLCFALDYGGRDEIIRAIRKIGDPNHIDEKKFSQLLDTSQLPYPNPDLIIRTGKEKRLSGFMLWQSNYAELYFCDKYFPDFDEKELKKALDDYQRRRRRFGQ